MFLLPRQIEAAHADADHFLPHSLLPFGLVPNIDGIWNLVLACEECNRGPDGKFAKVPGLRFLERLHDRNEYLIASYHPLRGTLMLQTGATEPERRGYLKLEIPGSRAHLGSCDEQVPMPAPYRFYLSGGDGRAGRVAEERERA